jgi:hypothetical protein
MTRDDLQELAMGVGMVKTPQGMIKPLWMASEAQLEAFAQAIIKDVKQSASEYVVQAIKKAVEYEREQCARACEAAGDGEPGVWAGGTHACAQAIRERGE